jgi:predicted Kef-type K+ transport protein
MELQWIGVAFVLGFLAKRVGQPPLVGFLVAGFVLEAVGAQSGDALRELADVGVLLLLFTIGLKLDLKSILQPQVWAVTLAHTSLTTIVFGGIAFLAGLTGFGLFAGLDHRAAAVLGFALSFSSTIFAVKVLEDRDDLPTLYGRTAVGILVVQDLAAVIFLAASTGKLPSPWAIALVALFPLRPLVHRFLAFCGHGELLVLGGLATALGGAALFDLVSLKADLGALAAGVFLGGHPKSKELAKSLISLKDVFLVGFFLTVGANGAPTVEMLLVALALVALLPLKTWLFYRLFAHFRLRARTNLLATFSLANYSEFGLIVGTIASAAGWLSGDWLVTIAIAVSISFALASPLNTRAFELYRRFRDRLRESPQRIDEEAAVDVADAEVLIFGMGRVGTGAYDTLRARFGDVVVGFDVEQATIEGHVAEGRRVYLASATDADFWERLRVDPDRVRLVLLAMSSQIENLVAIRQIRAEKFPGRVAATARYADEVDALITAGADAAFHVMAHAGSGFAEEALTLFSPESVPPPPPHRPSMAPSLAADGIVPRSDG